MIRKPSRGAALATATLLGASYSIGAFAQPPQAPSADVPSDAEIRQMLVDRIDVQHRTVGIVVGVITPQGQRIIAHGRLEKGDSRPLDGDTIFEIGSVSKVFTSLLLAQMVQSGAMALNDPVAKYLQADVKMPEKDGKPITLVDLATHTSGLERMPTNIDPRDPNNPFADYATPRLYEFLSSTALTRDPGSQYEYSNLAAGLLGFVVARRAGMSYEELVRTRICEPLNMRSTTITLTPEMRHRLAPGHHVVGLHTVDNWDFTPPMEAAGAIRSTTNDLLKFLAANLGYTKTPLKTALDAMLTVRRPTGVANLEVALAWHIWTSDGKEVIWHNGATGGYRSFIGFDPERRIGIVALSNTRSPEGADDIGRHLLDDKVPLWVPPKEPAVVGVDPKTFAGYVGTYRLERLASIAVTRQGDHLFAQKKGYALSMQATGQEKVEIFPESKTDFFVKNGLDVRLTFVPDAHGRAGELIVHEGASEAHAQRID